MRVRIREASSAGRVFAAVALVCSLAGTASAQSSDSASWTRLAGVVDEAIKEGKLAGAVVLVGQGDRILHKQVFGARAVEPVREPMTLDTIFDAASLTKVVATTTSVMLLVQEGRIRLSDRVAAHVPGFERYGKQDITIRHLLTHTSGLRPDVDLTFDWVGYDRAIELAIEEVPLARPDERFVYSDINFFVLGHIVVDGERDGARRVRADAHLRAARHARHHVHGRPRRSARASPRPRSARRTAIPVPDPT